jgi:hypothetical protein
LDECSFGFYGVLVRRGVGWGAQITDEAFNLALGVGPIGPAQPRHKTMMMQEIEEGAVVAMQSGAP